MANKNTNESASRSDRHTANVVTASAGETLRQILAPFASLKLTVVLMAMGILLVLFGTLAQSELNEHQVTVGVFRTWFTFIDFKWFFPPKLFPQIPEFVANGITLPGGIVAHGFPFPGGWVIGGLMAINLLAAHGIRFTVQAKGSRLAAGLGVIGLGAIVTYLVIVSGPDKDEFVGATRLVWDDVNIPCKVGLGIAIAGILWRIGAQAAGKTVETLAMFAVDIGLAGLFGYGLVDDLALWMKIVAAGIWLVAHIVILSDRSPGRTERIVLFSAGALVAFILGYLLFRGNEAIIDASGLRILWQLLKGFAAGVTLLVGCILAFKKRAGIVLLHAGLLLMMSNELIVYGLHDENQIQLFEGQSKNYVESAKLPELAFVNAADKNSDQVIVVPFSMLTAGKIIKHADLPVDVELISVWQNSRAAGPNEPRLTAVESPATVGKGRLQPLREDLIFKKQGSDDHVDLPAAFVRFLEKNTDTDLGVYLLSYQLDGYIETPAADIQNISVGDEKFYISMRPKRSYRPYSIKLISTKRIDYPGTRIPRTFESKVQLRDPEHNIDRQERIYMNNPLRYGGETFYQSEHMEESGIGISGLQVVTNQAWMTPYVGCMIVMTGLCAHFFLTLTRFIRRRDEETSGVRGKALNFETEPETLDSLHQGHSQNPSNVPWIDFLIVLDVLTLGIFHRILRAGKDVHDSLADQATKPNDVASAKASTKIAPHERFTVSEREPPPFSLKEILIPIAAVGAVLAWFIPRSLPPVIADNSINVFQAGQLAVVEQGRTKPLDTVARCMLRTLAQREVIEDGKNEKQPAIHWLLDLITHPEEGEKYKVFRIDHEQVQKALNLDTHRKELRYTAEEIRAAETTLEEQARDANEVGLRLRTTYHRRILDLFESWRSYKAFRDSLTYTEKVGDSDNVTTLIKYSLGCMAEANMPERTPLVIPRVSSDASWGGLASYAGVLWLDDLIKTKGKNDLSEFVGKLLAEERGPSFDQMIEQAIHERMMSLQSKKNPDLKGNDLRETVNKELAKLEPEQKKAIQQQFQEMFVTNGIRAILRNLGEQSLNQAFIQITKTQHPGWTTEEVLDEAKRSLAKISPEDRDDLILGLCDKFIQNGILASAAQMRIPSAEHPADEEFTAILRAYRDVNPAAFNAHFASYQEKMRKSLPQDFNEDKTSFESYFNYLHPFGQALDFYKIAMVLTALSWLGWFKAFNRAAFWVIAGTFLLHTFAIAVRIYLSGRPPVTNLYSVSVYVGWGAVFIGIVIEKMMGRSLGNAFAALAGIITLQIADYLALEKDTLGVMQAVLDTNFWLSTHVVCISTGYTVTYASALLGVFYIMMGIFTPNLSATLGKDIYRMAYGITCAAIMLSFFGTVLGGLWGDDSWGRFWGWDPKENGALIIVLWNTLMLHARWGGMVKERGFAVLAVIGAIVTTWSYFGVNQLGLGKHAYGFTEGVVNGLMIAMPIFLAITLLGCLPKSWWWSFRANRRQPDSSQRA